MNKVHVGPELEPHRRFERCAEIAAAHPNLGLSSDQVSDFMHSISLPASLRWAFLNNGKAASTTARRFLFEMEFGSRLSVRWRPDWDINPDGVAHHMQGGSRIFRVLAAIEDANAVLDRALRVTTVRHPVSRALSAFDYLCLSNDLQHSWFVDDRYRMNAVLGFDWARDPRTPRGFQIFLNYLLWCRDTLGWNDAHWRPQIDNICPTLFRPDIIGRVEDMSAFYTAVAERLAKPLPKDYALPPANRQGKRSDRAALLTPANLALIETIYAADFDWLGYDPKAGLPDRQAAVCRRPLIDFPGLRWLRAPSGSTGDENG